MWTRSEFAKFIIERERKLIEALREGFRPDEPESAPEPEPPPPPQNTHPPGSQQWYRSLRPPAVKGVDMAALGRQVKRELAERRLPRSPEEARGMCRW